MLCRCAGMSRQNYYKQRKVRHKRAFEEQMVLGLSAVSDVFSLDLAHASFTVCSAGNGLRLESRSGGIVCSGCLNSIVC